jgi:hypothetical protein
MSILKYSLIASACAVFCVSVHAQNNVNTTTTAPISTGPMNPVPLKKNECCQTKSLTITAPAPVTVSPNLRNWYNSLPYGGNSPHTAFSNTNTANSYFLHSFQLPTIPGNTSCRIKKASLKITKPSGSSGSNDTIGIVAGSATGYAGVTWHTHLYNSTNPSWTGIFGNYSTAEKTATIDLNFLINPNYLQNTTTNPNIFGDGYLSFYIEDDTAIKSAKLTLEICCDSVAWGNEWQTAKWCPTCSVPVFDVSNNQLKIPQLPIGTSDNEYSTGNLDVVMRMDRNFNFTLEDVKESSPTD